MSELYHSRILSIASLENAKQIFGEQPLAWGFDGVVLDEGESADEGMQEGSADEEMQGEEAPVEQEEDTAS